jgi:hypothetical protein
MIDALVQLAYVVATALFVFALHWMNAPGKPPLPSDHGLRYGDDERVRLARRRSTHAA